MDVRIGEIEATIVDTGGEGAPGASHDQVAKRVMAIIDRRNRDEQRSRRDRAISSPDAQDVERYG
jgi:hypothetical protein